MSMTEVAESYYYQTSEQETLLLMGILSDSL